MIHQGGTFAVYGSVLFDLIPRLDGITDVFIDDVPVPDIRFLDYRHGLSTGNGQPVGPTDGSYLYMLIANTLGDHIIQVNYTGPKGAPDDTVKSVLLPFTVVPSTMTISVTAKSNPPQHKLKLGDPFTLSGTVSMQPTISVGYVMFHTTTAGGKPLLSSLVPTSPVVNVGPPYGAAFIFRDGKRIAAVTVDNVGHYSWDGIAIRGRHTYHIEYHDFRGHGKSQSIVVFPAVPQRVGITATVEPDGQDPLLLVDKQLLSIKTHIYTEDADIPSGTGYKIPVSASDGSTTLWVNGAARSVAKDEVSSTADPGYRQVMYEAAIGDKKLILKYSGSMGTAEYELPDVDVAVSKAVVTLEFFFTGILNPCAKRFTAALLVYQGK